MIKASRDIFLLLIRSTPAFFISCASLTLENVNFGWPVESALTVSEKNTIDDVRYGLTCNVASLAVEEFQDTSALKGKILRVLRNPQGYYFVTGAGFNYVYVFGPGEGTLSLHKSISMGNTEKDEPVRLADPALNQRPPNVELLDGKLRHLLSPDGIIENEDGGSK